MRNGVAFIHTGAWGDLYVSLAALKSVCEEHPSSPVFVVGSAKWKELLEPASWPGIAELWISEDGRHSEVWVWSPLEERWIARERARSLRTLMKRVAASYNLRTESLRYAWAPWLARVPQRHGSAHMPWGFLYTENARWLGKDPLIHERDRMLEVVEGPRRIGELKKRWRSDGLPTIKIPDPTQASEFARATFGRYWLINPTSSRREKAWPAENFRRLFAVLEPELSARGVALRLIGAPGEGEWLRECLPPEFDASMFILQPPRISDLANILAGACALLTNTSSMQFLAPGYHVPTITLMGRGRPEIWGPLGPQDVVIQGAPDPALANDIFAQERDAYSKISFERVAQECARRLALIPPAAPL